MNEPSSEMQPQTLLVENERRSESGRIALLGFYYQLLDSASLATSLISPLPNENNGENVIALAEFIAKHDCKFVPEIAGEDLGILAGNYNILVQYKHTMDIENENAGLPIIRSVVFGMARSLNYLEVERRTTADKINACLLITNRSQSAILDQFRMITVMCREKLLPTDALEIGEETKSRVNFQPLAAESAMYADECVDLTGQGFSAFHGTVSDLCDRWIKEETDKTGELAHSEDFGKNANKQSKKNTPTIDPQKLKRAMLYVLPRFYVITNHTLENAKGKFEMFARLHGATDIKVDEARQTLVGKLTELAVHGGALTIQHLNRAVTGHDDARMLTPAGIGKPCFKSWKEWADGCQHDRSWMIPRYQAEFDALLNMGSRVICIVGHGGCGKTQLLNQVLEPYGRTICVDQPEGFQGFILVGSGSDVTDEYLVKQVREWSRRADLDEPMPRLRRANTFIAQPLGILLWVGFDGMDEVPQPAARLRQLLNIVRSPDNQDVCLLLTCRTNTHHQLEFALQSRTSGVNRTAPKTQECGSLKIGDFTPEDLISAAISLFPADIGNRFHALSPSATKMGGSDVQPVRSMVFKSLLHPRMLGALAEMWHTRENIGELDEEAELSLARKRVDAVLNEDPDGLFNLAHEFIWLCLGSYNARHEGKQIPTKIEYVIILKHLAGRCQTDADYSRKSFYELAREAYTELTPAQSRILYEETLSGGLIRVTDAEAIEAKQFWEWRHPFVVDCLKQRSPYDWRS